jgi:hypothetical protein
MKSLLPKLAGMVSRNVMWPNQMETNMTLFYKTMRSPLGELELIASNKGLTAILWETRIPSAFALAHLSRIPNIPC